MSAACVRVGGQLRPAAAVRRRHALRSRGRARYPRHGAGRDARAAHALGRPGRLRPARGPPRGGRRARGRADRGAGRRRGRGPGRPAAGVPRAGRLPRGNAISLVAPAHHAQHGPQRARPPASRARRAGHRGEGRLAAAAGERLPADALEERERRERLESKLLLLSPQHRAVLVLRDVEGLSYDEIAEVTETRWAAWRAAPPRATSSSPSCARTPMTGSCRRDALRGPTSPGTRGRGAGAPRRETPSAHLEAPR